MTSHACEEKTVLTAQVQVVCGCQWNQNWSCSFSENNKKWQTSGTYFMTELHWSRLITLLYAGRLSSTDDCIVMYYKTSKLASGHFKYSFVKNNHSPVLTRLAADGGILFKPDQCDIQSCLLYTLGSCEACNLPSCSKHQYWTDRMTLYSSHRLPIETAVQHCYQWTVNQKCCTWNSQSLTH